MAISITGIWISRTFTKLLFTSHPGLKTFPLLTYRGVIVVFMFLIILKGQFKYAAWDSVQRENIAGLICKVIHGNIA